MQKRKLAPAPLVMRLRKIDFWYWSRYFIDLYRDCIFGCSYCNTQSKTCFKGLDFLFGLPQEKDVITLGLLSDIYHHDRLENQTVSSILSQLCRNGYPVNILTKSHRIVNDLEILKKLAEKDLVRVTFTLLTLEEKTAFKLEGSAPRPAERLRALHALTQAGIPAGIAITPIIPFINDSEQALDNLVKTAKQMGSRWVLFSGLNPTSSFLNDPLWKKTREIHEDERALKHHYRIVKKIMLRLISRESLPMRIPRINFKVFNNRYYPYLVSEHLFNISYLYELLESELNTARYRSVAHRINNMNNSLKSMVQNGKIGYIRGATPEMEKIVEEIVYRETSEFYEQLYARLMSEV